MSEQHVIFGTGGSGREAVWIVSRMREANQYPHRLVALCEDRSGHGRHVDGIPVLSADDAMQAFPNAHVTIAVGDPFGRRAVAERCEDAGWRALSIVDPTAVVGVGCVVGPGALIGPGAILTRDVQCEPHVHVNVGCSVSHDALLGAFVTLSPGVNLAGYVTLEPGVFIGTGASVINGTPAERLVIGAGAVIAAGACVTHSLPGAEMHAGVPARSHGTRRRWQP